MVSFGLAFGKGVVTGLGKQQERKWAKEAYEESPEFELAGLQIKQAKENLEKTGWDIKKLRREVEGVGKGEYETVSLGANWSIETPKMYKTTPVARGAYGLTGLSNLYKTDTTFATSIGMFDEFGSPTTEAGKATYSYFLASVNDYLKDKKTVNKDGVVTSIVFNPATLPPIFTDPTFMRLPWVKKTMLNQFFRTEKQYNDYIKQYVGTNNSAMSVSKLPDGNMKAELNNNNVNNASGKASEKEQATFKSRPIWTVGSSGLISSNYSNQIWYADTHIDKEKKYIQQTKRAQHMDPKFGKYQIIDRIQIDHPLPPNRIQTGIGGSETISSYEGTGIENINKAKFKFDATEEGLTKIIRFMTLYNDPNYTPTVVGSLERTALRIFGDRGLIPTIGHVALKWSGQGNVKHAKFGTGNLDIDDLDSERFGSTANKKEALRLYKKTKKLMIDFDRANATGETLGTFGALKSVYLDLAYDVALANSGGDARSLSDKDFAYALLQIGDIDAWLESIPENNAKMAELYAAMEEKSYTLYAQKSKNFAGLGIDDNYDDYIKYIGVERANMARTHLATLYSGVRAGDTYSRKKIDERDPSELNMSDNPILLDKDNLGKNYGR